MCILQGPLSAEKTVIIAGPHKSNKDWQVTGYLNTTTFHNVENSKEVQPAMLLPFPNPTSMKVEHADEIEFVDFEATDKESFVSFGADVGLVFREKQSRGRGVQKGGRGVSEPPLAIQRVGNYNVSVALTVTDLARLDKDVFVVDDDVLNFLVANYQDNELCDNFGVVVCGLVNERRANHPMAFTHPILPSKAIFTPTLHYHLGGEKDPDWDHDIVVLNCSAEPCRKALRGCRVVRQSMKTVVRNSTRLSLLDKMPLAALPLRSKFAVRVRVNQTFRKNIDFVFEGVVL